MAQTSLRARLQRLFSTNVIVRHAGGRKLKIADTNRVQQAQRNSLVDRWSRLHTNLSTGGYGHSQAISFQAQRLALFRDYEDAFELLGNVGSYGEDGYSLKSQIFLNGKKKFKRLLVKRKLK